MSWTTTNGYINHLTHKDDFDALRAQTIPNVIFCYNPECGNCLKVLMQIYQSLIENKMTNLYQLDVTNFEALATHLSQTIGIDVGHCQILIIQDKWMIHNAKWPEISIPEVWQKVQDSIIQ